MTAPALPLFHRVLLSVIVEIDSAKQNGVVVVEGLAVGIGVIADDRARRLLLEQGRGLQSRPRSGHRHRRAECPGAYA